MVADDQMQMPAVDAAQAFECVLDGATVGEVAENPQFVVVPDDLVDIVDDGVLVACDVADRFERCLIVVHILFDPRVCGGAGLRLPDVEYSVRSLPLFRNPRSAVTSGWPKCVSEVK